MHAAENALMFNQLLKKRNLRAEELKSLVPLQFLCKVYRTLLPRGVTDRGYCWLDGNMVLKTLNSEDLVEDYILVMVRKQLFDFENLFVTLLQW